MATKMVCFRWQIIEILSPDAGMNYIVVIAFLRVPSGIVYMINPFIYKKSVLLSIH